MRIFNGAVLCSVCRQQYVLVVQELKLILFRPFRHIERL